MWRNFILISLLVGLSKCSINIEVGEEKKPNIILILSDDQDIVMQGMIPMKATQKLLGLKGMTFLNAFTSTPFCCPSRSSILSGQYAHNHATINNSVTGGCYGDFWKDKVQPNTIPVLLENHGYETFFAGKYLNQYYDNVVPPGWKNFYGLHGNSRYYNYSLTENGKVVHYQDEYLTDVVANYTMRFLKNQSPEQPFFAMIAPPAAHSPFTSAPRHNNTFEGVKAPRTPSYNLISGPLDKHWLLTMGPELPETVLDTMDKYFRKRWQTLLAIDEMVESIIQHLEETKLIENTYIVYTSDNGYHIGQFGQPFDKRQPYETDIRLPFIVRGPNIPEKSVTSAPVALIDLFPTFLEWAGLNLTGREDGQSFATYATQIEKMNSLDLDETYHRQILIEYWGEGNDNTYNSECPYPKSDKLSECTLDAGCRCQDSWNNTYACIRHFAFRLNNLYCEFKDEENFVEAYELDADPYQMKNLGYEMLPSERALYSLSLNRLSQCIGDECRKKLF